ncbi:PAS domain-containing protein [Terriglobus albidus]|uniref:PAS domain-containing protein n=1 Tax=Terriglobus albidus TaxID=1592106 RepID=UPI0021DF9A72|nr:PAS domain-containing protein [Terriglobus albidus]
MSSAVLHVLFVDNRETDILPIRHVLESAGLTHTYSLVSTGTELRAALTSSDWDLVICGDAIQELPALVSLQIVRELAPAIPFLLICVCEMTCDEHADTLVKAGAQDYLQKDDLSRLPFVVLRELRTATERRTKMQMEFALRRSEERIRLAAGAANLGIWSYNVAANVIDWDAQCYAVAGVPQGTIITPELFESLIHSDDRARRREVLAEAIRKGSEAKMEYRLVRPDGGVRWILSHGRVYLHQDGTVKEILGVASDITDRKVAEQALRASEARFRSLSASSPVGIFQADLQANVSYTNPRLQEIWHMKEPEILGRGWTARIHPNDLSRLVEGWSEASSRGSSFEIEYRLLLPDGEIRWIFGRSTVVFNEAGLPMGTIGTVDDITDRRRVEESLRRSEKLAAVGKLASMIAHEINNPLEAVTNFIYLAETSSEINQETQSYLRDAQHELQRVSQIATQTLQFHRQSNRQTLTAPSQLLESALALFARRLNEQQVTVERDFADVPAILIHASDIRQVLVNLLSNALDAMAGAPGKLRLQLRRVSTSADGIDRVRITVADTGSGMESAVKARVFDAFFTTKGEKGSGLGLWVSGEIIARHGGRIQIRSRKADSGGGTVISFTLPVNSFE